MKEERILKVLGQVEEKYIAEAAPKKIEEKSIGEDTSEQIDDSRVVDDKLGLRTCWMKWGAVAACICLIVVLSTIWPLSDIRSVPESPKNEMDAEMQDGPPHIVLDDQVFYISAHMIVSDELPEGFSLGGNAEVDGVGECSYYLNPEIPEWVYIYQEVQTDGTVDENGTLNRTEPHNVYVRYVDARLRNKDLLCYNGNLYISMWSAVDYGENPDVSSEFYEGVREKYGIRMEGQAPAGFVHVGTAEFSGHDTIPRLPLASNKEEAEVYADPDDSDVVLVSTQWYTATVEEGQETKHEGYNVYILYNGPLK